MGGFSKLTEEAQDVLAAASKRVEGSGKVFSNDAGIVSQTMLAGATIIALEIAAVRAQVKLTGGYRQ